LILSNTSYDKIFTILTGLIENLMSISVINESETIETQFSSINKSYIFGMTEIIEFNEGVSIKEIGENDYIKVR